MVHILYAEDNEAIQLLTAMSLERLPSRPKVTAVDNGQEGLTAFLRNPRDWNVLVTDCSMPRLDGWGFLEGVQDYLREHPEIHLPRIMYCFPDPRTDMAALQQKVRLLGGEGLVMKPRPGERDALPLIVEDYLQGSSAVLRSYVQQFEPTLVGYGAGK